MGDKCKVCGEELVPMDYYDEFGNIVGAYYVCVNDCEGAE